MLSVDLALHVPGMLTGTLSQEAQLRGLSHFKLPPGHPSQPHRLQCVLHRSEMARSELLALMREQACLALPWPVCRKPPLWPFPFILSPDAGPESRAPGFYGPRLLTQAPRPQAQLRILDLPLRLPSPRPGVSVAAQWASWFTRAGRG